MKMLEGKTFFFDLTVPATLAVLALLLVLALWSPFLSRAKQKTGYRLQHNRNDPIPYALAQPHRTARRQFSHQRALRYWNTRLDEVHDAPQTELRGCGQIVTFRRTKLE